MKAFVINGSPKGGRSNTYRLTKAFLKGLDGEVELREAAVAQMEIKPCLGCFACWSRTPGQCCIRDDMDAVLENLLWADTIIWSFPLYYFSIPGPLKNLMDRQLPMVLPFMNRDTASGGHPSRHDMSGKRHVVISTCGFYTAKGNYDGVNAVFDHLCGRDGYTAIYCGQGELFRVPELAGRTGEYLAQVTRAGREFSRGSITKQTREKLEELLFPRETFEAMADASWGVEQSGEKTEEALVFTRQMAALYNKSAWPGRDLILEMRYTDIGRTYQILLGRDGSRVLTEPMGPATTTIETTYALWKSIAAGEISGEQALMEQRYRVMGDFNLMIQWDRYFGGGAGQQEEKPQRKERTSMLNLMPWAAFWTLMGVHPLYGPLAVIALCALLPVLMLRTRRTVYDAVSALGVTVCACAALAGVGMDQVMNASFFIFGLVWTVSCFCRVPLSAHYSVNSYGDAMAENPLFLRTNRIICAGWGGLYLLIPVLDLILMNTPYESLSGLLLSAGSAAMGIFTLWFQRWYPAKVARGK